MAQEWWQASTEEVLRHCRANPEGLTSVEAERRRSAFAIRPVRRHAAWRLLLRQFTSPVMLVLIVATVVSLVVADPLDGLIILVIIVASGLLGFVQERRADIAMVELLGRVQVHADVLRDGVETEVLLADVVTGDIVVLRAGDIAPADLRLIEADRLLVDESSITGEPEAAEKSAEVIASGSASLPRTGVFFGSHVVSGSGRGVVVAVGTQTRFGSLVERLESRDVTTRFEREMTSFGFLLLRVVLVLVAVVLAINLVLQRGIIESLMFALAVAVGITPQLLPAIVTVSLSLGARRMAEEDVLVKRLDAIEDIGAMTVLACDKTGTLTRGVVQLDRALDTSGSPSERVLRLAGMNAGLQRGYPNALDAAILHRAPPTYARALDEVPYDFTRRRLSVLVRDGDQSVLITKGAYASVMDACPSANRAVLDPIYARLSSAGYRVIAVATRDLGDAMTATVADEQEMTCEGVLAFMDPPTDDARRAVDDLRGLGVDVVLVTGDNALVARHVAEAVGLSGAHAVTGEQIAAMDDRHLAAITATARVFAEVDPLQKERLVLAFRSAGATVGFLGDGINDSAALKAADAGISVDSAADVAKHAAALVVMTKDLAVIADGVRLGRRTFANTLKYIRVTISANFGNMVSLVIASALLPFLPLLPVQILLLNLLSDVPAITIATDRVDADEEDRPRTWSLRSLRDFMIAFGLVSSVFDLSAFAVLRLGFAADDTVFRSSWFVLSLVTECLALLVLRTGRPCWRSRPGTALLIASAAVVAFGLVLPFLPVSALIGLGPIPIAILATGAVLCLGYVAANEVAKAWWRRARGWQAI